MFCHLQCQSSLDIEASNKFLLPPVVVASLKVMGTFPSSRRRRQSLVTTVLPFSHFCSAPITVCLSIALLMSVAGCSNFILRRTCRQRLFELIWTDWESWRLTRLSAESVVPQAAYAHFIILMRIIHTP